MIPALRQLPDGVTSPIAHALHAIAPMTVAYSTRGAISTSRTHLWSLRRESFPIGQGMRSNSWRAVPLGSMSNSAIIATPWPFRRGCSHQHHQQIRSSMVWLLQSHQHGHLRVSPLFSAPAKSVPSIVAETKAHRIKHVGAWRLWLPRPVRLLFHPDFARVVFPFRLRHVRQDIFQIRNFRIDKQATSSIDRAATNQPRRHIRTLPNRHTRLAIPNCGNTLLIGD